MNPKIIVIIAIAYSYGFFEVIMNLRQRRKNPTAIAADKGSLRALYLLITIGYVLSFSIGATKIGRIYYWDVFFAFGVVLIVIGLIIRIKSILTLKNYFTYSVAKTENHKLIETGLYKNIRHPGYLGQLIIFIGISTTLSNWLSILLMLIPVAIGYIYRINIEEKFMIEQFGVKYSDYQKRTKKLIPKFY